jgi:hypothetical protein
MTFRVGDRVRVGERNGIIPAGLCGWVITADRGAAVGVCLDQPVGVGHSLGNRAPDERGFWFEPEDLRHISYRTLERGTKVVWRGPRKCGDIEPGAEGVVMSHQSPAHHALVKWGKLGVVSAAQWELDVVGPPPPSIVSATERLQALTHQAQQLIEEQT